MNEYNRKCPFEMAFRFVILGDCMSKKEWYRQSSWSKSDRDEFFSRLGRAREYNRAQYLRIQAVHLEENGFVKQALELLELMIQEYPDKIQKALAHYQKATCYLKLGKLENAECEFRNALQQERVFPNALTPARIEFGWYAISNKRKKLFPEVISILNERKDSELFPIERYKSNAIRAIIANADGNTNLANHHAKIALAAASKTHSGFRYHPDLGLVKNPDKKIHRKLLKIAR